MKFFLNTLLLLLFCTLSAQGQKLVIGSEVDDLSKVTKDQWLSRSASSDKVWVIDFFAVKNPSSMKFYNEELPKVKSNIGDRAEVVIVSSKDSEELSELAAKDGDKYCFVTDSEGKLFKIFDVKYIPFSVVVDSKGTILWQGNISELTKEVLDSIL